MPATSTMTVRLSSIRQCTMLRFALLMALLGLRSCRSYPTFIVDSGRAKCVSVESPMDTVLEVHYTAPGTCVLLRCLVITIVC